jgi:hypothetical protein
MLLFPFSTIAEEITQASQAAHRGIYVGTLEEIF